MLELVIIPLIFGIYFLPTVIAVKRDHRSSDAIFLVNLFLGATIIGWLVALAWSLKNPGPGSEEKRDQSGS